MEKKELIAILKEKGLEGVEDLTRVAIEEAFELIEAVVEATPNKIDDAAMGFVNSAKPLLMSFVDKIDGKED